jgi:hypothetical protein
MTKEEYKNLYLEYINDYLTVEKFAEHKGLTIKLANNVINLGRYFYQKDNGEEVEF